VKPNFKSLSLSRLVSTRLDSLGFAWTVASPVTNQTRGTDYDCRLRDCFLQSLMAIITSLRRQQMW
jgi:hypothetical protein